MGDLDQCDEETRHRREAEGDLYFDPFDSYEDELQEARSNAAVRLSGDMALALRQVKSLELTSNDLELISSDLFRFEQDIRNGSFVIFPNVMVKSSMVHTANGLER